MRLPTGRWARRLASLRAPGGAGVLVRRDAEAVPFVWGRCAPWPGAAPVTPATGFRWYSLTKPFTAALLRLLEDEGALHGEQLAETWLPELAGALGRRAGAEPVRVLDLARHTAGLRDRPLDAAAWFRAPGLDWPDPDIALASVLGKRPRWSATRSRISRYGNLAYATLGQVLARAGGLPFRELLRRRLLLPWGLEAAWSFDERPRDAPRSEGQVAVWSVMGWALRTRRARHFVAGRRGGWWLIRPREAIFSPHGGLVGRPAELAPLLRHELQRAPGVLPGLRDGRRGARVEPGWYVDRHPRLGVLRRHGGRGPGFTGELVVAPESGVALALVVNRDSTALQRVARGLLADPGNEPDSWRSWEP